MNQIERFLRVQIGISDEAVLQQALKTAYIYSLRKGELLIKMGECPPNLYFLLEGVMRGFFLDTNGNEITDCFGHDYGIAIMPYADFSLPSPVNIVAEEDSQLLAIPISIVLDLLQSNLEVANIYNRLLLEGVASHAEIKTVLYRYSAAQRLEWFLDRYEGLIDRVPHAHIASFLGMTPVHLSRLRHRKNGLT